MKIEQTGSERAVMDVLRQSIQQAAAGTVFGEPVTRGETTIIPVARISGRGGGGGGGPAGDPDGGAGSGSGVKLSVQPAGVFAVDNARVRWRPSLDVNRVVLGGQLVAVVALLTLRTLIKTWGGMSRTRRRWPMSRRSRG